MNGTFHVTVDGLKQVEKTCYQMNYYLLQDEGDALRITKQVLLELAEDDSFLQRSKEEQKRLLLKRSAHHAFALQAERRKTVSW